MIMKKVVKYVLPLFAAAVLVLSLSSCGKLNGAKYKTDKMPGAVLAFNSKTEWSLAYKVENVEVSIKGTYKVEKKKIKLTGKNKVAGKDVDWNETLEIQDNAKKKLKDSAGRIWVKM